MANTSARSILFWTLQLISRLRADRRGIGGIEFAFIAPVMVLMFIGAIELSQAIIVDRRVTQTSSSIADLVARQEKKMQISEMTDIMRVGGFLIAPYNQATLQVIVRNVISSPTDANNTKQSWQCTASGSATPVCTCTNDTYAVPSGLVTTNDSVVIAEANYTYSPRIFDYFLKRTLSVGAGGPGTYTFTERTFMKPRGQTTTLVQQNGSDCPSPTY